MYKKRQKCTGRRQKKALKKKAEVHRQKAEEGIIISQQVVSIK
jgi:hypothetical protein